MAKNICIRLRVSLLKELLRNCMFKKISRIFNFLFFMFGHLCLVSWCKLNVFFHIANIFVLAHLLSKNNEFVITFLVSTKYIVLFVWQFLHHS